MKRSPIGRATGAALVAVAVLLSVFTTPAAASAGLADGLDEVAENVATRMLQHRGANTVTQVDLERAGQFTPTIPGAATVNSISFRSYQIRDDKGAYTINVFDGDRPTASAFWVDDLMIVGTDWELASAGSSAAVVRQSARMPQPVAVTAAGGWSPLGCTLGVGAVGGGTGSIVCTPLPFVGNVVCGVVGGVAGGLVGFFVCQDEMPQLEGLMVDKYACTATYCDVKLTARTLGSIATTAKATIYWDREPNVDWIAGALPCRPACTGANADYSISQHTFGNRTLVNTYPVPSTTSPGSFDSLREYSFSGRLHGSPACYVDQAGTTYAFFSVTMNGKVWRTEASGSKPKQPCPY